VKMEDMQEDMVELAWMDATRTKYLIFILKILDPLVSRRCLFGMPTYDGN